VGIAGGLIASVLGLIFDGKKTAAVAGLVLSLAGAMVFLAPILLR
jgi:hypothetical protein